MVLWHTRKLVRAHAGGDNLIIISVEVAIIRVEVACDRLSASQGTGCAWTPCSRERSSPNCFQELVSGKVVNCDWWMVIDK